MDYNKVLDYAGHEHLPFVLEEMDVAKHLIVLICNLHSTQEVSCKAEYGET